MSVMYIRNEQTGEFEPVPSLVGPQGPPGANGGGAGTVTSVNKVAPDANGNVTLTATNVGALPAGGTAVNADKLNGKSADQYMLKTDTAADSAKLGGVSASEYTTKSAIKSEVVEAVEERIAQITESDAANMAEVISARTDEDGVAHVSLKTRIDSGISQLKDTKVSLEKERIAAKDCNPTKGKYLADDTGKLSSSSLYSTTDFIPMKNGMVYAATGKIRNVLQYDENQNPIAETFMQVTPVGDLSGYSAVCDGFFRMSYNTNDEDTTFITTAAVSGNGKKIEEGTGLSEFNKKQVTDIARDVAGVDALFGKKWAVCGDSFTAGQSGQYTFDDGICAGERKIYPYFVRQRTGIDVLKFYASGRTLAYPADRTFSNSLTNPGKSDGYTQIPEDVDYVTIYLGINDSQHDEAEGYIPIGTISDESTSTYYGAWNVVLSWMIANRPNAHIGIIVSNGVSKMEYRDAQIAIAEKYGIPYIDLNGDERTRAMIRPMNEHISDALKETLRLKWGFDPDGSRTGSVNNHPNEAAHEFESYAIEAFLRSI